MKKIILFLILAFAGTSAWSKVCDVTLPVSFTGDSAKVADINLNRKFMGNGNTLLNMRGSIPDHLVVASKENKENPIVSYPKQDKLIAKTLLFTGKLTDHIGQPFWIIPESGKSHTPVP